MYKINLLKKFEKFISRIERDEKLSYTFLSLILVVMLWWMIKIEMGALGLLSLLIYWFISGVWLGGILRRIVKLNDFWSFVFGIFLAFYLTGFGLAFWIVFYKITLGLMMVTLVGMTVVISVVRRLSHKSLVIRDEVWKLTFNDGVTVSERFRAGLFKIKRGWWLVMGFLVFISVNVLFYARTGDYILSPWYKIHPLYSYLFIVISFFVLVVIFSKCKIRTILLVIILHSFLLHAYLPTVYKTGFGGDKWRHVAAEQWLDDGKIYSPSLFGEEEVSMVGVGPFKIPEVFVVGNQTSYANQWGLTMLIGKAMNLDFFKVDFLLGFILWSLLIPLFLFRIGRFFSDDRIFLGLLAFAPSLFYPLHVYGAITLPVSFGFLFFIFMLMLWLQYLEKNGYRGDKRADVAGEARGLGGEKAFLVLLTVLTLLMYFNYLIYLVLILMTGVLIVYFKKAILPRLFKGDKPSGTVLKWFFVSVLIFFAIIPILDRIGGASNFKAGEVAQFWLLPVNLLEFVLGKMFALGRFIPRPTFISQGNFIFMQIWESLSRATFFRFINWPAFVSIFIWGTIAYGIIKIGKAKSFRIFFLWILLLIILLFDHFFSMYYMEGVRLLTKRFDLAIAFFMMMLFVWGVYGWLLKESQIVSVRAKVLMTCLVLAIFSGVVYASGPKLEVVTSDEVKAAKFVWNDIKREVSENGKCQPEAGQPLAEKMPCLPAGRENGKLNYCVLANTWPLLAVEMESSREITGGGFPTYLDYAQPERVMLWKKMTRIPSYRYLEKAQELTGASFCYFMVEKRWLGTTQKEQAEVFARLKEMFSDYERIGDVYVFYYD